MSDFMQECRRSFSFVVHVNNVTLSMSNYLLEWVYDWISRTHHFGSTYYKPPYIPGKQSRL